MWLRRFILDDFSITDLNAIAHLNDTLALWSLFMEKIVYAMEEHGVFTYFTYLLFIIM